MENMKITLVPIAGLCNRMNAITSGLLYKKHHPETELGILWWKTHDCCADWCDLFEELPSQYSCSVQKLRSLLKDRPATPRNLYIPRKCRKWFYDFEMNPSYRAVDFDELVAGKKKVFVACHNNWNQFLITESLADIFIPQAELRVKIENITSDWKNDVVGLHIRRTDNTWAIKNSPIEKFYRQMDEEINKNNNVRFYLATDDEEVKKEMKARYGARIITLDVSLKRNSVQGMKDAVVDLFCLGKTTKIFGSHHSTYSIVASQLYNIKLIV